METIQQLDAHSLLRVITIHTHIEPYTIIIKISSFGDPSCTYNMWYLCMYGHHM